MRMTHPAALSRACCKMGYHGLSFRARARDLIEPAYRFCSILPKETENAKAFKEPGFSMTPAARLWNVGRAWMSPWPNESQKAIESVLAVFTLGISSTRTSGKEEFIWQQPLTKYRRLLCSPPLAGLRPDPFPSELQLRRASGLNTRTARASGEDHTVLPPKPTFARSYDFETVPGRPILSYRHKRRALLDRATDSSAGSTNAAILPDRGGSRRRCDEISRWIPAHSSPSSPR
jgi:hypothetical protein